MTKIEEIISRAGIEADLRIEPDPPKRRYELKRRNSLERIAKGTNDAAHIARYLLDHNITQTELAERLCIGNGQMSNILNGRTGVSRNMRALLVEIGVLPKPEPTSHVPEHISITVMIPVSEIRKVMQAMQESAP